MEKMPAVYIMANRRYGTLYVGVTTNLIKRVAEHKSGIIAGFTAQYNCKKLVFLYFFSNSYRGYSSRKKIEK